MVEAASAGRAALPGGPFDVIVVGGGNAALCAALEAAERRARVLILEAAPKPWRGGNSRHTRNIRLAHDGPLGPLEGTYGEEEFLCDLLAVTKGRTDEALARLVIRRSRDCLPWMERHGVTFQPSLTGTLSLTRTNAFFLGGGKALLNAYYNRARALGIGVAYETPVRHVVIEGGRFRAVEVEIEGRRAVVEGRAVVLAAGGFEADLDKLARGWGPAARNFLIRGTPYNRGEVLDDLLAQGARSVGDPTQCHCVAIDGRAPRFDGGIATRLDCVPFGIVVNRDGARFYDEGEDVWPKRYAIWGRLVALQPEQIAFAIVDADSLELFMPSIYPPIRAATIEELAGKLELPAERLAATVARFNAACRPGRFHPTERDGLSTEGLDPPKSNWARPLRTPPFAAWPLRPGVTFTYLGLAVDERARVQGPGGPFANVLAAGEIMAGSILGEGYLAGFGMTIGTVFGRIAGEEVVRVLAA